MEGAIIMMMVMMNSAIAKQEVLITVRRKTKLFF